jgi:hypothetical protein
MYAVSGDGGGGGDEACRDSGRGGRKNESTIICFEALSKPVQRFGNSSTGSTYSVGADVLLCGADGLASTVCIGDGGIFARISQHGGVGGAARRWSAACVGVTDTKGCVFVRSGIRHRCLCVLVTLREL